MKLHKHKDNFIELIQNTSSALGIQDIFIEKDYWVTYVLKNLTSWDKNKTIVFKGGTSLSKAYKLIDRFSEDVDLVLKDTSLSGNQIKTAITNAQKSCIQLPLEEVETDRTSKGSRIRKVDCSYPQILDEYQFGDASDKLLIEVNSFSKPFPVVEKTIGSYIFQMLQDLERTDLIEEFELTPFTIEVLDFKQTFCEKVMSLLRISQKNDAKEQLRKKIRHFYDISKLISDSEIINFIKSKEFSDSLKNIYKKDLLNPEFQEDWAMTDVSKINLIANFDSLFDELEPTFKGQFKTLLYTREKIEFSDVKNSFSKIIPYLQPIDLKN